MELRGGGGAAVDVSSTVGLPAHVVAMVRRALPRGCGVVPGSTPVVAFGDPRSAEVATLGINPSWAEFCVGDELLTGARRRLADAPSLGLHDPEHATDDQVRRIVADCADYFSRPGANPYWTWFRVLEKVLVAGCDASYLDGTACHLDLVQWATRPVWSKLPAQVRTRLLRDGVPHLRAQLERDNIRLVLLNGRQVLDQVHKVGLVQLAEAGTLAHLGDRATTLYRGTAAGVRFLGWSVNLQGTPGANANAFLAELAEWVRREHSPDTSTDGPAPGAGALERGTRAAGAEELRRLLRTWLQRTDETTIGDVGRFGGSPWLHVDLPGHELVLNADTKRSAVQEYVDAPSAGLFVVANRRGVVNKVVFRSDRNPTPGWYCYTRAPLAAPGSL